VFLNSLSLAVLSTGLLRLYTDFAEQTEKSGFFKEFFHIQAIPVVLDPAGKPVECDFVHIKDLVREMLLALDRLRAVVFPIGGPIS
jgi:nucleoside-diphosphate-sugar epimerase